MIALRDSETDEIVAEFDTVEDAIAYADDHDLKVYIKWSDIEPPH